MIELNNRKYTCPVDVTLSFIGGKWKILILSALHWNQKLGFSGIRSNLPGVSDKVLSQQLLELENDNLIRKSILSEKPYRVEYQLSDDGLQLVPIVDFMSQWGINYLMKNGIDYIQDQNLYKPMPEVLKEESTHPST